MRPFAPEHDFDSGQGRDRAEEQVDPHPLDLPPDREDHRARADPEPGPRRLDGPLGAEPRQIHGTRDDVDPGGRDLRVMFPQPAAHELARNERARGGTESLAL